MTSRFVVNAAAKSAEIFIYDPIGDDFWGDGLTAKSFKDELKALKDVEHITVRINSPGGDVFDADAIYSLLKEHPARVDVAIDGLAASAATIIAMAGETITMSEAGMFMIHPPSAGMYGDSTSMRKLADVLDQIRGTIIKLYRTHTHLDDKAVGKLVDAETWMTAQEALENGFIDKVIESPKVVACAGLVQVAEKLKFHNIPADLPSVFEMEKTYEEQLAADIAALREKHKTPEPVKKPEVALTYEEQLEAEIAALKA